MSPFICMQVNYANSFDFYIKNFAEMSGKYWYFYWSFNVSSRNVCIFWGQSFKYTKKY